LQEEIVSGSSYHGHSLTNKDNLYKTINYMSKVKFKINNSLLNYIENEGNFLNNILEDKSEELQRITTIQIAKTYENTTFYLPLQSD
jgi:hypothetical protein